MEATARRNYPLAVVLVALEAWAASAGLAVLGEPEALAGPEALVGLEALAALAEPEEVTGSITRRIVEARLIATGLQQTSLAVPLAETRWLTGSPGRGSRSDARAAICPAITAPEEQVELVVRAIAEVRAELAEPAIAEARAERTASAAAISRAAEAETGTLSEGETTVSTDRAHAPAAAVAPPAWDLAAAGAALAAAVVGGGGKAWNPGALR